MLCSIHDKWPSRTMHAFPRVLVKIEAINPKKMIEVDFTLSSNKILIINISHLFNRFCQRSVYFLAGPLLLK